MAALLLSAWSWPPAQLPVHREQPGPLAFVQYTGDWDIYRLRLGGSPTPLIQSTFSERQPKYSPDGRRIAFESDRAVPGSEIWLADADGSESHAPDARPGPSPGNARLVAGRALDRVRLAGRERTCRYLDDRRSTVWTCTRSRMIPADDTVPIWSRDGRFIYFSPQQDGAANEIWRAGGRWGAEVAAQREGEAAPSKRRRPDLYYERGADGALRALPRGVEERTILPCVSLLPGLAGIFTSACEHSGRCRPSGSTLLYWTRRRGRTGRLRRLESDGSSACVSPRWPEPPVRGWKAASDLMMIENFPEPGGAPPQSGTPASGSGVPSFCYL